MATPGALVTTLAQALGLPEATLVVHDRNLVKAGLRTKGGRGWSAAHVTPRDAPHLVLAVLASAQVKDSVEALRRYELTSPDARTSSDGLYRGVGLPELARLGPDHSFIDALEALLASASTGALAQIVRRSNADIPDRAPPAWPLIEIAAISPGALGELRLAGLPGGKTCAIRYCIREPARGASTAELKRWAAQVKRHRANGDLTQQRRVTQSTIRDIAVLLSPKEEMGS